MKVSLAKTFFYEFGKLMLGLNTKRDYVKRKIGDSTNNNRALSVSQVIRFINKVGTRSTVDSLGTTLEAIYELIKEDIVASRNNNRTDSVDTTEFLDFYFNNIVIYDNFGYRSIINNIVAGKKIAV